MKRILVTGAAGFTARYLGQQLSSRGDEVHGVVRESSVPKIPGFARVHSADVTDRSAIGEVVRVVRPHHIVHLAAVAFVSHADLDLMYRVNIFGTRQLLDAVAQLETPPVSVLLASSANVYGNARNDVLDESTPPQPANDYAVTKVAMEFVASLYAGLPLIIARPFNYTGRGQGLEFIVPKIVDHVRRRAHAIELGNLDVARDFSDVRTVVDAYARLLDSPEAVGQTFNICSGCTVELQTILKLAQEISGHRLKVRLSPALVRTSEVRNLKGSRARIESVIGPLRNIPLEDTLRWMINE